MRFAAIATLVLLTGPFAAAQESAYHISFGNRIHHEAEVRVTFSGLSPGELDVRMSRSSPGRYALHEFAKNVYSVSARDGSGEALSVAQRDPYGWQVSGHNGTVVFEYTLFADRSDGTYSGIDGTHAHLNMPATFVWAPALRDHPVFITFEVPESDWRIATQLLPTADPSTFTARDVDYFLDSPTEISPWEERSWDVRGPDGPQRMRIALHHRGSDADFDEFARLTRAIVHEQEAVFGEFPAFDGGVYTFIVDYLPHVAGDGMEHRNSTIVSGTRPLAPDPSRNVGTMSHEFFHTWNVERIRPRALEPFNFAGNNVTDALWFSEGFTSYYTGLTIRRAGITDDSWYAASLGGGIDAVVNGSGREYRSPAEMSRFATMADRASFNDPTNSVNTFISYYTWGSVLGLALDLGLRSRYDSSLDAFMRAAWERFGREERPFELQDLQAVLGDFMGEGHAAEFFDRFVYGREVPDLESLLTEAGLLLRSARPAAAWIGAGFTDGDPGVVMSTPAIVGTPAYEAGLERGDRIMAFGGVNLTSADQIDAILALHSPGDVIEVEYEQRGVRKHTPVATTADPALEVITYEDASRTPTPAMLRLRRGWLDSQAQRTD